MKTLGKIRLKITTPPLYCEPCGMAVLLLAARTDDPLNQVMHYCPHHNTSIHVIVDEIDGWRVVTKWYLESPISEECFVAQATKHGEKLGATMEVSSGSTVQ